jgi:hypothetical protein
MTETLWTDSRLISVLKLHLSTVDSYEPNNTDLLNTGKKFDSRKYYNQAYHYLRLGACNPIPDFLISLSDLTPRLVKELSYLESQDRNYVLKQAVGRIFEDINTELYHDSISKALRVKLIK